MSSVEVRALVPWPQILQAITKYVESCSPASLCTDDVAVLRAAAQTVELRLETVKPGFFIPVAKYRPDVWAAAMSASFAMEGVKDQTSINMMVADSLLTKPAMYREKRQMLIGYLTIEHIKLLDDYLLHNNPLTII